ncbi:MAG: hypothetical protein KI792_09870 [Alphaproteobacteria bacterium]|nr:hypothetical protein [Alphaproteobacteria bacterium SS10]
MGSLIPSSPIELVTTGVGLYQDVRTQQQENNFILAQQQQAQQQAQLDYERALQEREWELQRRALEEQYRQQELAQQQALQQQQYDFAVQQQQYELEQRAYDQRLAEFERNRLALDQQNQLAGLIAEQDLNFAQAQANLAQQQTEIQSDQATAEEARRSGLRRAVARQRASLGARGIETTSGSGEAVLLGLINESEAEGDSRRRSDALREQALTQDLANLRQQNLLERTRLAEAQRFQLLTLVG